ncbi:hypothetical protein AMC81_PE01027 (plasmid) [Rhizobium phaseoli]|uniref:Uncharacterized protein n=1 Tax=Rhizobium phaseoli TaxID=396 RepID=A0ABM6CLN0_9HYPH|nr:hypothetical protein AMC81_PE01027 [Rhizobium phaseoli]ANL95778.1 hypothetical protein AMC80_PE01027 [Rhizobium phaseoli]
MREFRTYGSVRGALSNERPYRDLTAAMLRLLRLPCSALSVARIPEIRLMAPLC